MFWNFKYTSLEHFLIFFRSILFFWYHSELNYFLNFISRLFITSTNTIFFLLIFHHVALLNLFIISSCFMNSLERATYRIMSELNTDSFSSFSIWIPLISFSCMIALARTLSIMLNRRADSFCCCSGSYVESCSVLPLNMMVAMLFGFCFCRFLYHGEKVHSVSTWCNFLSWMWVGFCQMCFFSVEMIMCFLIFDAKTILCSFDKSHLVKVCNSLGICMVC